MEIKNLSLTEELNGRTMCGISGGFSSFFSWFFVRQADANDPIKHGKEMVDDDQSKVQF
jgi:hypothetical protein